MKKVIALIVLKVFFSGSAQLLMSDEKELSQKLRIAYFANVIHAPALLNSKTGDLKNRLSGQVEVKWIRFQGGPAVIEALFSGEIDMGYIGPVPAIIGYIRSGGVLKIVSGSSRSGSLLVSRKGLSLKGVRSLSGKKIAVPQFGNTQDLLLRQLLIENGLKDTVRGGTVDIHQAESSDIKMLMDHGHLDAALVPEPWGSRLVAEIGAEIVLEHNEISGGEYDSAVVFCKTDFLDKYPQIVRTFLDSHREMIRRIKTDPDESRKLINIRLKELTQKALSDDVITASLKRVRFDESVNPAEMEKFQSLLLKLRYIRKTYDIRNLVVSPVLEKPVKSNP